MPGRKRDPRAQAAALRAAEELLDEVGYHRVTMDRIAERSGVAKMTLYRWWPNKAAVVTDAVRDRLAPPPGLRDAHAHLTALVETLTRYGDASVVAAAMTSRGEEGRADLAGILQPWTDGLTSIVDGPDAELVAHAWMGFVVYRLVFLQRPVTPDDVTALLTRLPG